jgi:tripartite-type tricarboxylate transporter receptor subunit TctC
MGAVAKATHDGHTLGIINLTQMVAPNLLPQMPYDTVRDLAPVTQISWTANILVLSANSPIQSVAGFIALAKANPNQLTYASAGNGTPSHLASELFKHHAGIDLRHISFKGIGQGLSALLGAQVDIAFAGIATAAPFIRSGKLRALGTAAPRRLLAFPELRTIAEQGFPGPDALAALIRAELPRWKKIVRDAGVRAD